MPDQQHPSQRELAPTPEPLVGQPFVIPKGVPVHSVQSGRWAPSKRSQTVTPHFVDRYRDNQTMVTWAGTGGYWKRVSIDRFGDFINRWPS
jgi:hypothetical protein